MRDNLGAVIYQYTKFQLEHEPGMFFNDRNISSYDEVVVWEIPPEDLSYVDGQSILKLMYKEGLIDDISQVKVVYSNNCDYIRTKQQNIDIFKIEYVPFQTLSAKNF